jgi:hypothetical protein
MTENILTYFAGFFDGEGYIGIAQRKGKISPRYQLDIGITSTNLWILQELKFKFGGSICKQGKTTLTRHQAWAWRLFSNQACAFLKMILPSLRLKRNQAELAIKFQSNKKNTYWQRLTKEQLVIEEAQKILMKQLKNPNNELI